MGRSFLRSGLVLVPLVHEGDVNAAITGCPGQGMPVVTVITPAAKVKGWKGSWLEGGCRHTGIVRGLRADGRLVLLDDVCRDPAAVLDLDALSLGPLADPGGVDGGAAVAAAGRAPGPAYLPVLLPERFSHLTTSAPCYSLSATKCPSGMGADRPQRRRACEPVPWPLGQRGDRSRRYRRRGLP